jgi:endonuclease I
LLFVHVGCVDGQCKKQEVYSQEKQKRAEEKKATRFDWQEAIITWYGS